MYIGKTGTLGTLFSAVALSMSVAQAAPSTKDVMVVNNTTTPVPVVVQSSAAQEPWERRCFVEDVRFRPDDLIFTCELFSVPAGKRLHIQYASAGHGGLDDNPGVGKSWVAWVGIRPAGSFYRSPNIGSAQEVVYSADGLGQWNTAQKMDSYANGPATIECVFRRNFKDNWSVNVGCDVSGVLIDQPL